MALSHFRILIHELLSKDTYIVPEEAPMIILDSKYDICMAKNGKDTKHKTHCKDNTFSKEWRKVQGAQD